MAIKKLSSFSLMSSFDPVNDLIPVSKQVSVGIYETRNIPTGLISFSGDYNDLTNKPTLGSASTLNVGILANNVVQLDNSAKLPAVDGSELINIDYNSIYNSPTLGTSASLDYGTSANQLVRLDASARLPAIDGSLLTNLPSGFTSPLTTKGDILVYSTINTRLPVGVNGQYLIADSSTGTGLLWSNLTIAYQNFNPKTASYSIVQSDHGNWISCSTNNLTITLPNGLTTGTQIIIDRQGTQTVTITASGTLQGKNVSANSVNIANQWGVVHCVHQGSNVWRITGDL